jgi:hypothetical protein
MEEYLFNMGVSILLQTIKNPEKKRKLRNVFLKVFRSIKSAFPDDKDFQ